MPQHRSGGGPAMTGPIWLKNDRDDVPRVSCMTPMVFSNQALLTKNDTRYLHYGGAGTEDAVSTNLVPAVVPFDCSIVAMTIALNSALAAGVSTHGTVTVYRGATALTGTFGAKQFTSASDTAGDMTGQSSYWSQLDLNSYVCTAGQLLSVQVVTSNQNLGTTNNIAVTLYTV